FLFCLAICLEAFVKSLIVSLFIISFYGPNILQTFLIMLKWPINLYFVKLWLFILILSSTRNVSYYTNEAPDDFLATSTTLVQVFISYLFRESTSTPQSDNANELPNNNEIREMKKEDNDTK